MRNRAIVSIAFLAIILLFISFQAQTEAILSMEWFVRGELVNTVKLALSQMEPYKMSLNHAYPWTPPYPEGTHKFEGIQFSRLLDIVAPGTQEEDMLLVAKDMVSIILKTADIRKYPILLAFRFDGNLIGEKLGGPFIIIFPYENYPELKKIYPPEKCLWYVTNVVVGTEKARLKVSGMVKKETLFTDTALTGMMSALNDIKPLAKGWPNKPVNFQGVLVSTLVNLCGVASGATHVTIAGKAGKPRSFLLADILKYPFMIALQADSLPIRPEFGGPSILILPYLQYPEIAEKYKGSQYWIKYAEEVKVE